MRLAQFTEKYLPSFSLSQVRNFVQVSLALKVKGIDPKLPVLYYQSDLADLEQALSKEQEHFPPPPRCPRCGNPLFVMPITKPKGKGNVKGWRSYVCCSSDDCLFERFYRKPVADLVREIMRRRAKGLKEVEDGNC